MNSLRNYWDFLLQPNLEQNTFRFRIKLWNFLVVLGLDVVIVAILLGVIYSVKYFGWLDINLYNEPDVPNMIMFVSWVLSVTLVIPLIEEFVFRLHLRPTKVNLGISVVAIIIYPIVNFFPKNCSAALMTIIGALVVLLLVLYFAFSGRINRMIEEQWHKNYLIVFCITALVFGGVHILNYKLTLSLLIFSPLVVAPQLFLGVNIGYLRVRYGFGWGLLLHIVHNIVFAVIPIVLINPAILSSSSQKNALVLGYPPEVAAPVAYHLRIEESRESIFNTYKLSPEEILFEGTKMKTIFSRLANADSAKVFFEEPAIGRKILNVKFLNEAQGTPMSYTKTRHFLIGRLLKKYNLKAELFIIPAGNWILTRKQYSEIIPGLPDKGNIKAKLGSITVKDATISDLAEKIESLYHVRITSLTDNREENTFIIPMNDIMALREVLSKYYGLDMDKVETKTTRFYISSRE